MKLRKDIPDEALQGAGVYGLDPNLGILASQAAALLNRSRTRMDSDRRDGKPPPAYKDGAKVLYKLGDVLETRAQLQGKTLEQAAREAADRQRGWPSFHSFAAKGGANQTWPIAQVRGLPTDFFATLGMDISEDEFGEVEDLTRDEFVRRRVAFFQDKPRGWGVAPTAIGRQWADNMMQMATSRTEGWDKGYQQALSVIFDDANATSRAQRRECKQQREALEHEGDYQGARQALDASPDDLHMSRFTAQFYLGMSPGSFKKALERGPHPFAEPRGGATKGEVDAWFQGLVKAKHAHEMTQVRPLRVSRDLSTGRPYLVDVSGAILADGAISNIDPQDVAYAASMGAGIRILSLTSALAMPWRDPAERQPWAWWRNQLLEDQVRKASDALARAQSEDMKTMTRALPTGQPPDRF